MLGHLALSVAMAFVYGDSDADMARRLDDMNLGAKSGVGLVVSYGHGVSLRVPVQPLASISGTSLGALRASTESPDPGGGLELALAELERIDDVNKELVVDSAARGWLWLRQVQARIASDHVTVRYMGDEQDERAQHHHAKFAPENIETYMLVYKPPSEPANHVPWQPLASLALLGLAAGLARRATV